MNTETIFPVGKTNGENFLTRNSENCRTINFTIEQTNKNHQNKQTMCSFIMTMSLLTQLNCKNLSLRAFS